MRKLTTILMLLIFCTSYSWSQNEKREKYLAGRAATEKKIEEAKATGDKDAIKAAKKAHMPFKKVYTAVMPVYVYNPSLKNAVGANASINFNLDKNMGSPLSNVSVLGIKSIDNGGWMAQLKNNLFVCNDNWRFNQQILFMHFESPYSAGGTSFTIDGDMKMFISWNYRKVAKNLYTGLKLEYNTVDMDFGGFSKSSSEFFNFGWLLDYDTRDKKLYPTKGVYTFNALSLLHHSLGYKATNPETGLDFDDPVAEYFVGYFKWFYSPVKSWKSTLSMSLRYEFRMGDTGTGQWLYQTQYQRGFKSQTVYGNRVALLNAEYAHFFDGFLKGNFGVAGFTSYGIYGQGNFQPKFKYHDSSGLYSGSAFSVGCGLRYMLIPRVGVVFRADWGYGTFPGADDEDSQNAFNLGIGKYF